MWGVRHPSREASLAHQTGVVVRPPDRVGRGGDRRCLGTGRPGGRSSHHRARLGELRRSGLALRQGVRLFDRGLAGRRLAWAGGRVRTAALLRNWTIVYFGNFAGAVATAGMVYFSGQHRFGTFVIGRAALEIATAKVQLNYFEAICLGVLCNILVCLAVWLTYSCRTTTDRILAIVPPISAFVAAGYEHSVANMYFVPLGLFLKHSGRQEFVADAPSLVELTWSTFLFRNLLPVTIGNLIGGTVFVGGVYYFVYLRRRVAGGSLKRWRNRCPAWCGPVLEVGDRNGVACELRWAWAYHRFGDTQGNWPPDNHLPETAKMA